MKPPKLNGSRGVPPRFIGIVGGSGAGKSWLADRLAAALAPRAGRLSLDDFYHDRSHLSSARRARLNFDHPRAIDWPCFEAALSALGAGRAAWVPRYDFATHARQEQWRKLAPKPIWLIDGLWLLRRRSVRRRLALAIFLECPARVRLQRRLSRDQAGRGRSAAGIRRQFQETVEPMHARNVAPQAQLADLVLGPRSGPREIAAILRRVRRLTATSSHWQRACLASRGLALNLPGALARSRRSGSKIKIKNRKSPLRRSVAPAARSPLFDTI